MKKNIILIFALLSMLLVACSDETQDISTAIPSENTALDTDNADSENLDISGNNTDENTDNLTLDTDNSSNNTNTSLEFNQTATHKIDDLDFGVGYGIKWEDGIFAPFADMGAWVTDAKYSNSGTLNLGQIMADTGIKYFNLGFINAVDSSVDENGVLNWGFGAYEVLSEEYADSNTQYQGIKKAISDVRANGGDVVISIGGLIERNFFQYSSDIDVLVNTYIEIIDGFNLTRIDLDIEGSSQGYDANKINAQAMKIVQEKTGVEVVLTLPVLPTGLTENLGLPTLQVYIDEGVDIKAVNIMAMCYGSYFGDYAEGSIDAIDSTMEQIKDCYKNASITLTDDEAYNKVGVTTSIGFEGESHPIFTTDDSQTVVNYSISRNINFVSFWSLNRDSQTQDNKGIYSQYEHTNVYLDFEDDSIVIIPTQKDDTFDDYEYIPPTSEHHMWTREEEANGTYVTGFIVAYKGALYEQVSENVSWWCEPGTNENTWKTIGVDDTYTEGSIQVWSREIEETGAYTTGTLVIYKGKTYEQVSENIAWWCEPGTDNSIWKLLD